MTRKQLRQAEIINAHRDISLWRLPDNKGYFLCLLGDDSHWYIAHKLPTTRAIATKHYFRIVKEMYQ